MTNNNKLARSAVRRTNTGVLLLIFIISAVAYSCGTSKQLQNSYIGKTVGDLSAEFGTPVAVLDRDKGKIYVFEKTEELESTKIDQGRISLDPMVTPSVIKTERYYFTVIDGKIINARVEEEYER